MGLLSRQTPRREATPAITPQTATRFASLLLTGLFFCLTLTACTAVTSEPFSYENQESGIPYSLPTALVTLAVSQTDENISVGLTSDTAKAIVFVPDREARFRLEYHPNAFATDRLCVTRSNSGLLNSVQFASDDATDEILIRLAELAAKIAVGDVITPVGQPIQFDPLSKAEQQRASALMPPATNGPFTFEVPQFQAEIDAEKPPAQCRGDAVCFREKVVTPLVLKDKDRNIVAQTYITVADKWSLGRIQITRPFLVEEVTKIGFDKDGFLTSLAIKRPSEVLATAQLPLSIIDRILAVPGNFLGRAFGSFAERKQLLTEQKELAQLTPAAAQQPADATFALQCTSTPSS